MSASNKTQALKQAKIAALSMMMLGVNMAYADERESLEQLRATTTNLIDLLVEEGVLSKDKAQTIVKKAHQDAEKQAKQQIERAKAEGVPINTGDDQAVRVQYVPEHVKKEMRAEIEKEVMEKLNYKAGERLEMPSWLDRISFNGDIRLRYQNDNFGSNNTPSAILNSPDRNYGVLNSSEERRRFRLKATLGADVKVNEWLVGGMRFVTGQLSSPVSPNQTESIADGKYVFGLDRAFLRATPVSWLTVSGGRFANPFMLKTDLLWDHDLAFDGVAATFTPQLSDSFTSFTTVGAFPMEEIESSEDNKADDKWLYSLQTGIKWTAPNKSTAKLAIAYHDFENVEGRTNPVGAGSESYNATAPAWRQKGNNTFDINRLQPITVPPLYGLASEFKLVNLTGQLDLTMFDPIHVVLTGDYVKNIGFDKKDIFKRTGNSYKEETDGYQVRIDVGSNTDFLAPAATSEVKKGDWNIALAYKRLEADAVLDGYTDSDFGLGGTDSKGWVLSGNYGLGKNTWVSGRYLSTDSISAPGSGGNDGGFSVDVLLLDFSAKF